MPKIMQKLWYNAKRLCNSSYNREKESLLLFTCKEGRNAYNIFYRYEIYV